jgi:hypothetical protein
LEQKESPQRIDHHSYARQGIEKVPTVHMGVAAMQMKRRGIPTEKGAVNRKIAAQNRLLKDRQLKFILKFFRCANELQPVLVQRIILNIARQLE